MQDICLLCIEHCNEGGNFKSLCVLNLNTCSIYQRPFRQPEECLEYKPHYRSHISEEAKSLLDGVCLRTF